MEYRRVESIRGRLRAVCKLWKAVVEDLDVGFTITDWMHTTVIWESHLSHARRIEFPSTFKCICMRCPYKFAEDQYGQGDYMKLRRYRSTAFNSDFKPNNVRIVSLNHAHRDVAEYLKHAPQMVAFGGEFSLLHYGHQRTMKSIFKRLTHLSVNDLSPRVMSVALRLPRLRFLQLVLTTGGRYAPSTRYIPLSRWELPNLTSLVVDGAIQAKGRFHEDFLRFLHNHCTHIENLVIQYDEDIGEDTDERNAPPIIDVSDLRQYSRLKVLGVNFRALDPGISRIILEDAGSFSPLRLSLLLCDGNDLDLKTRRRLKDTARHCIRLCTPIALFDEIVLSQSWNQLIWQWDAEQQKLGNRNIGDPFFTHAWVFFKELHRAEVRVVDKDGVRLWEGDGLKFLERCNPSFERNR
ncbi:hypothetical protein FRC18_012253 [Serendipita sp. 400]|nr:hypothetical protein FRC18_012253 [Serendipita sp. 400]